MINKIISLVLLCFIILSFQGCREKEIDKLTDEQRAKFEEILNNIHSIKDIENVLSQIQYRVSSEDNPAYSEAVVTYTLKYGNCTDFYNLTKKLLERLPVTTFYAGKTNSHVFIIAEINGVWYKFDNKNIKSFSSQVSMFSYMSEYFIKNNFKYLFLMDMKGNTVWEKTQ